MTRTSLRRFAAATAVSLLAAAALAAAVAPANAAQRDCSSPYELYVINPLTDTLLVAADLDGDAIVCVSVNGDVASVVDDSDLAALLPTGLLDGWISVDAPVTIEGTTVTIEDILNTDQRGNRNNVVGANLCSQNTGNSCFSNNKVLQHVRVVLIDDVISIVL